MQDDHFEWDDDKAVRNWRDHAVTFAMAREAFQDPFAVEWEDAGQHPSEARYGMIATVENRSRRLHDARRAHPDHHGPQGGTA